jgi:phosphate transport system substrate-binding protein
MRLNRLLKGVLSAALGAGLLAAAPVEAQNTIKIDGSSTVYPITEKVAEQFQSQNKDVKVTVGISGTGGGMKKFTRGEIDIADASRPIKKDEMAEAQKNGIEFIELPIAYDALTVVVNRQNDWAKEMTVDQLKRMWAPESQGKVLKWSDIESKFPGESLKLYGPGADSGTFEYFTEAVVGKAKSSRTDYTASEDDNVLVNGVKGDKGAIGYFGMAYYMANKDALQAVAIVNPKTGKAVLPSAESVETATYAPLSRPIFIYVKKSSLQRPEVRKFVEFYLTKGPELVEQVKYVPLPDKAYEIALNNVKNQKTGTLFPEGHAIGVSLEELMQKEGK